MYMYKYDLALDLRYTLYKSIQCFGCVVQCDSVLFYLTTVLGFQGNNPFSTEASASAHQLCLTIKKATCML